MMVWVQLVLGLGILVAFSHQQTCSVEDDQALVGANLAEITNSTLHDCCGLCIDSEECGGYVWNGDGDKNGTCVLKEKAKDGQLKPVKQKGSKAGTINSEGEGEVLVTWQEFKDALNFTNYTEPTFAQYDSYLLGLPKGSISTKQEAAMALTHFIWESDGLKAKREYKCLETGCPGHYEVPNCDVEGQDYYGRGYIQLTWCYNYKVASYALFGDDRLVQDPDFVARDENTAWNTAFWFWGENVHTKRGVSDGKFGVTTKAINGGWECAGPHKDVAKHRFEMYKLVRAAFGLEGKADESGCYN